MSFSIKADGIWCKCHITDSEVCFSPEFGAVKLRIEDIIGCEVVSTSWFFNSPALNLWHIVQMKENVLTKAKVQITGEENAWRNLEKEILDKLTKYLLGDTIEAGDTYASGTPELTLSFEWGSCYSKLIVTKRPKSLLVLINPIGGKKRGVQEYQNTVSPIFSLANIICDVFVSNRPKKIVEIMTEYDTNGLDGIVVMGGDGSFTQVANVLIRKEQEQAGVDYNDPGAKVQPIKIPIAMIPTGTGNYVAGKTTGCRDIVTSALHVVRGHISHLNVLGIYADEKLVDYAGAGAAYGLGAELLHLSDFKYRWLGQIRYYAIPIRFLLLNTAFKTYNAEVTCYTDGSETNDAAQGDEDTLVINGRKMRGAKLLSNAKDTVLFESRLVGILSMCGNIINQNKNTLDWKLQHRQPQNVFSTQFTNNNITASKLFKQLKEIVNQEESQEDDFHDALNVRGLKVRVLDKDKGDGSDEDLVRHLLQVDGEIYRMESAEFQFWLHENIVPVFTSFRG